MKRTKESNLPAGRKGVLIPEAANRETVPLTAAIPVGTAYIGPQGAEQGVCSTVLRRTPPETVVANAVERTIAVAGTTRKTCKTTAVRSVGIRGTPERSASGFHFTPSYTLSS